MITGRKASGVYGGMREDEKEQKVPVPSKGKVDNSRGPLGYNHGKGEEDKEHGPGVTPNPDKTTGPGVGLTGNGVDNSPSPVPRKR
ncbi:hypothetical protein [Oribacterium parvum]|uniref:hypothetical protein n=1 Tax=Oribacterium parvum TaxID=1501329 RepID=UPI0028E65D75|nr:hypothetical protein [Oribacterium parvum]